MFFWNRHNRDQLAEWRERVQQVERGNVRLINAPLAGNECGWFRRRNAEIVGGEWGRDIRYHVSILTGSDRAIRR